MPLLSERTKELREKLLFDLNMEYLRKMPIWFNRMGRPCVTKNKKTLFLHHFILDKKYGFDVDHIDGNPLNNKLENLRYCTHSQNMFNRKKRKDSEQLYKGVQKLPNGKYRAKGSNGVHLGVFITPEEAYDRFISYAKEKYGLDFVLKSIKNIQEVDYSVT